MYRGKLNFCGTYSYVTLQLNPLYGQRQTEPKVDVLPGLQNRIPPTSTQRPDQSQIQQWANWAVAPHFWGPRAFQHFEQ